MAFMNDEPSKNQPKKISRFVRLDEGKPVMLQVLETNSVRYFKYWFRDSTGRWVGYASPGFEECPITQRNLELGKDHPDYIKPQKQFAVNVFDVTPHVVCPECEAAFWPTEAPAKCECGKSLADLAPRPLNVVRILERGKRLFSQLNDLDQGTPVLDEAGEQTGEFTPIVYDAAGKPLRLTGFVVQIIRSGKGVDTVTTPIPMTHLPTVDSADHAEELHDLPAGMDLTPDEVLAILDRKVPLADIFAARRAEENADSTTAAVEKTDEESLF